METGPGWRGVSEARTFLVIASNGAPPQGDARFYSTLGIACFCFFVFFSVILFLPLLSYHHPHTHSLLPLSLYPPLPTKKSPVVFIPLFFRSLLLLFF